MNSESPYDTFGQGGNVSEWNESRPYLSSRGLRGASFSTVDYHMLAADRNGSYPTSEYNFVGFRVAEVPEPATIALLVLGGLLVARRRR